MRAPVWRSSSNVVHYPRISLPFSLLKQTKYAEFSTQGEQFDLVASLEVIEHVENPAEFVSSLAALTRPGGMLTLSTINRTAKVSRDQVLPGHQICFSGHLYITPLAQTTTTLYCDF